MVDGKAEKSVRVFFALWPDDAERAALAAWQLPLHKLCSGRIIRADTLHNTLVFLGNVEAHRLEAPYLAAQAQALGARAIAGLAPSYFKPRDLDALVACCAEIAAAANWAGSSRRRRSCSNAARGGCAAASRTAPSAMTRAPAFSTRSIS